jgi:Ca2+-binding RTX toxin-like protein
MAVFTAADANVAVNMSQLFAFEPTYGTNIIQLITAVPGAVAVADFSASLVVFSIKYSNVNGTEIFDFDGTTPENGSFDKIEVFNGSALQGTLSGITPGLGNFGEIDLIQAYKVLLGDDTITGSNLGDFLLTGDGGTDTVDAKDGGDVIGMSATAFAPFHSINGGAGTDTISAISNVFTADTVLDLRNATLQSIEGFLIEDGITVRLLGSQIGAGVSSAASVSMFIGGSDAALEVVLNAPGAADLSGFTVDAGVSITVFGSAGTDTISGTSTGETIRADAGTDTVNGNGGADTFLVSGTAAEFDAMNGGAGTDTLSVEGGSPLTLNGFNAAAQAIEAWDGNGQGLQGNGNANLFDLSGLASLSGLAFIAGGAGDDTITGSKFADVIRGGLGKDTMAGGLGGDRFDFDAVTEIGKKKGTLDLISDWGDGDRIDLSSIDANGAKKGDKAFKFLKKEGADFTKAGQVGFDQKKGNTFVEGDTNGDGKVDFRLQLAGEIDFSKADFVL